MSNDDLEHNNVKILFYSFNISNWNVADFRITWRKGYVVMIKQKLKRCIFWRKPLSALDYMNLVYVKPILILNVLIPCLLNHGFFTRWLEEEKQISWINSTTCKMKISLKMLIKREAGVTAHCYVREICEVYK